MRPRLETSLDDSGDRSNKSGLALFNIYPKLGSQFCKDTKVNIKNTKTDMQ